MAAALNTCMACLRWTVFALNLFFWLAGLGILGVALWLRFDPAVGEYVMQLNKNMEQFHTSIYLLMAAGAIMALFGFLGCFGALKMSPAMLTAFFILLVIVFTIELACGLVAYFHRDMLKDYVEKSLSDAMQTNYGRDGYQGITDMIDNIQSMFECCGVKDYRNYHYSYFTTKHSDIPELGIGSSDALPVPKSCCNNVGRQEYKDECGIHRDFHEFSRKLHDTHIYQRGCSEVIQEQLQKNLGIIIGLAVGIGCFQLLGMVLSMLLCCMIGYRKQRDYGKIDY